jgi:MFS family permease
VLQDYIFSLQTEAAPYKKSEMKNAMGKISLRQFTTYRWVLFAMAGALYFMVCFHRLTPTVIARDLVFSLHADAVTLGIIASAYFYLYSGVQPIVGYLSDTVGPRKIMSLFFVLAATGTIIFATAANAGMAALGRALLGAGLGGIFIPSLKLFSRWYPAEQFTGLTGIMLTISGLGSITAALPLTYLVALLGWRMSFLGIGIFSFVLAASCWMIVRDSPEEKGWTGFGHDYSPSSEREPTSIWNKLAMIFGKFDFWIICLATFLTGGAASFQGLWAVPYLLDVFGISRVRAGWILMSLPLGFALGGPLFGFLISRFCLNRKRVLLFGLGWGCVGWIVMIIFHQREHLALIVPIFFLLGLSSGGTLPLCYTITRDLFPLWLLGTASGLMNMAAFFGTALYQPFTGYLLKGSDTAHPGSYSFEAYRILLIVFALSYLAAAVSTALLRNREKS